MPRRVSAAQVVTLTIGSWPVEPGQSVWVTYGIAGSAPRRQPAAWRYNAGGNSYWQAEIGPFASGAIVDYRILGRSPEGDAAGLAGAFRVGPKLHLALLWHQHQPLYKDVSRTSPRGSYRLPWVRLHAIRDYYSMAALAGQHPGVHLTINLTPVLLWQIEDYTDRDATDRALELTLKPAEALSLDERRELLETFFDADPDHQIAPHPRYAELWAKRQRGEPMTCHELRDVQMWFNLAWFGKEFRDGEVRLATGATVTVHRYVEQARDFSTGDIAEMVADQLRIMRATVPLHRALQDAGQIEVSTTPFSHPILPLLVDTDAATIDRAGSVLPPRFARPEDAEAQLHLAAAHYERVFDRRPRGMWPAEGAVSQSVVPLFADVGVSWIATDSGVLAHSGRWGYRVDLPDVLCRPYRAEEANASLAVFFRDAWAADRIGFHYQHYQRRGRRRPRVPGAGQGTLRRSPG